MTTNRIVTLSALGVVVLGVFALAALGKLAPGDALGWVVSLLTGAGILGAAAGPSIKPPKPPTDASGRVDIGALLALAGIVAAVLLTVFGLAAVYTSMGCASVSFDRPGPVDIVVDVYEDGCRVLISDDDPDFYVEVTSPKCELPEGL